MKKWVSVSVPSERVNILRTGSGTINHLTWNWSLQSRTKQNEFVLLIIILLSIILFVTGTMWQTNCCFHTLLKQLTAASASLKVDFKMHVLIVTMQVKLHLCMHEFFPHTFCAFCSKSFQAVEVWAQIMNEQNELAHALDSTWARA